jgi:polyhydroxybutyrate depolymerase
VARISLFALPLLMAFIALPALAASSTTKESLEVGGETRLYLLHVPPGLNGEAPLVLSFHGNGMNAEEEEDLSGFSKLADDRGFVVVYPQADNGEWRVYSGEDADVVFIDALIGHLTERLPIDRKRIYANGISLGAQFAWRLACDRPQVFAAMGLVAGGYPGVCQLPRPPLILFHGTHDRILPYDGGRTLMPVRDFARGWAARDNCHLAEQGEIVFAQGDAKGERWACGDAGEVVLYTLEGNGHSWPGSSSPARITSRDIDASRVMLDFFAHHTKH